jgi:hypothetical protein
VIWCCNVGRVGGHGLFWGWVCEGNRMGNKVLPMWLSMLDAVLLSYLCSCLPACPV